MCFFMLFFYVLTVLFLGAFDVISNQETGRARLELSGIVAESSKHLGQCDRSRVLVNLSVLTLKGLS